MTTESVLNMGDTEIRTGLDSLFLILSRDRRMQLEQGCVGVTDDEKVYCALWKESRQRGLILSAINPTQTSVTVRSRPQAVRQKR
jgi:hypothetical protein